MNRSTERQERSGTPAILSGGVLGACLLAWISLTFFAPGFGMVLAVFGSPVFAFFMLLRLLTLSPTASARPSARGKAISEFANDSKLLHRVIERDGTVCTVCHRDAVLRLQPILPIGRRSQDLERRFVAKCPTCYAMRHRPRV